MTRHHAHGFATGALLVIVAFLVVERQTGGPRPRPAVHLEFADTTSLSAALRDYDAIQSEREERLTDSVAARLSEDPVAADWNRILASIREYERRNNALLTLICRQQVDPRYCR